MKELKMAYYQDLLNRFDTYVVATKSIKSGNYYTGNIRDFFLFLERQKIRNLNQASEEVIQRYFGELTTRDKQRGEGKLSYRTINANLSSLRMLSKRMQKEGELEGGLSIPVNFRQRQEQSGAFQLIRSIVTKEEVKQVYEACENDLQRSLLALAYGCGLRRSSLESLKDMDIDYHRGVLTVQGAKNNKTRQVPISNFFLSPLRSYSIKRLQLMNYHKKPTRYFFIDQNANRYSGRRLNELLKKMIVRTGNQELVDKQITLHCLRHSIATHLMDAGQSFDYVKQFLGHSMVDTTTIYARRRKIKNYYTL